MKKTFLVLILIVVIYGGYKVYQNKYAGLALGGYSGPWKDGTYTGSVNTNQYGSVQVDAVVVAGKISSIDFLQMPSDRAHSAELSSYAEPQLLQEAISAQNANVNIVSGATLTSESFQQSLQSALNLAPKA